MIDNIKKFYENLSNDYIKINNVDVVNFCDLYLIRMNIEISRLNLTINYGTSIPYSTNRLTRKLKTSLIDSLKLRINNELLYVKLNIMDKLG